jgi:hypothetical protein
MLCCLLKIIIKHCYSRYDLKVLSIIAFIFLLYINGAKIQEELKSKNKKKITNYHCEIGLDFASRDHRDNSCVLSIENTFRLKITADQNRECDSAQLCLENRTKT